MTNPNEPAAQGEDGLIDYAESRICELQQALAAADAREEAHEKQLDEWEQRSLKLLVMMRGIEDERDAAREELGRMRTALLSMVRASRRLIASAEPITTAQWPSDELRLAIHQVDDATVGAHQALQARTGREP
jgi:predicted  nucleic acid-binding Zn-ribbon protein